MCFTSLRAWLAAIRMLFCAENAALIRRERDNARGLRERPRRAPFLGSSEFFERV